jgi:hypothetical protein
MLIRYSLVDRHSKCEIALPHYASGPHARLSADIQIARNKFQRPPRFSTLHSPRHFNITQLLCWRNHAHVRSFSHCIYLWAPSAVFLCFFSLPLYLLSEFIFYSAPRSFETSLTGPLFAQCTYTYTTREKDAAARHFIIVFIRNHKEDFLLYYKCEYAHMGRESCSDYYNICAAEGPI